MSERIVIYLSFLINMAVQKHLPLNTSKPIHKIKHK